MKKLVIFDLDGTLLDTISDLGQAANYTLSLHGYPTHHLSSYPHFVGNGISRLIERVLPAEERSEELVARLRLDFIEYYNHHLADHTHPYPGIRDLLLDLTDAGIGCAVASNKYQEGVDRLIKHFFPDIPWVAIEGQRDGMPTKPDPSIVFDILGKYPTRKANVLYVGDSGVDMETARRAAIESVGVSWGFRSVQELTEAYADHIVHSPAEIYELAIK